MKHTEEKLQALWDEALAADKAYRAYCDENGIDPAKIKSSVGFLLLTEVTRGDRKSFDKAMDFAKASGAACRRYQFARSNNNKQVNVKKRKAAEMHRSAPKEAA